MAEHKGEETRSRGSGRRAASVSEKTGQVQIAGRQPAGSTAGGRSKAADGKSKTADARSTGNSDRAGASRGGTTADRRPARERRSRGRRMSFPLILLALIIGLSAGFGAGWLRWGWEKPYTVDLKAVEVPKWVKQDFIRKNIFSRPDVSLKRVDNIVIHYVANPGKSALQNRNYFDGLADQDPNSSGQSASAHFIVGLEGEVIQCIPVSEMAYAAAPRNNDTISIETCHLDETGEYTKATYDSLVKLTASLCFQLKLDENDLMRHYDVNGKNCPKYFVEDEGAWKQFKKDVKAAIKDKSWLEAPDTGSGSGTAGSTSETTAGTLAGTTAGTTE